jgi:hypothetical protein
MPLLWLNRCPDPPLLHSTPPPSIFADGSILGYCFAVPRRPSSCTHCSIPSFIRIADGKTHEIEVLDDLVLEPGVFYLMDRGYLNFSRLFDPALVFRCVQWSFSAARCSPGW